MAKWNDVQKILNDKIPSLNRVEEIPMFEALNRISTEEVKSKLLIPQFNRSLVDGYAISNLQSKKSLKWKVIGEIKIGFQSEFNQLEENESVYVPTGGIIPEESHSVVKIEDSKIIKEDGSKFLVLSELPDKNAHIELSGSDITINQILSRKNTVITPQIISLLSSVGINRIKVYRRPRITIIVTGHEVIPPGKKLELGQVYDSTSALLMTTVKSFGGLITNFHRTGESKEEIIEKINMSIDSSDLILTTGGTSVGKADNVVKAIEDLGKVIFHGVNIRPGKPVVFGKIESKPIIGFPGFVTSTAVISSLFFPIVFQKMNHLGEATYKQEIVPSFQKLNVFQGWYRIIPGYLKNGDFVSSFKTSSAITSYSDSKGYVIMEPEDKDIQPGEIVVFNYYKENLG